MGGQEGGGGGVAGEPGEAGGGSSPQAAWGQGWSFPRGSPHIPCGGLRASLLAPHHTGQLSPERRSGRVLSACRSQRWRPAQQAEPLSGGQHRPPRDHAGVPLSQGSGSRPEGRPGEAGGHAAAAAAVFPRAAGGAGQGAGLAAGAEPPCGSGQHVSTGGRLLGRRGH